MLPGLETISLSIPTAMAMGLAFGAGPCNITCLPYLGPVFVAGENGQRQAWRTVLPFSLGRLVGYSLLGLTAGTLGQALQNWLASPLVGWVLGGATIVVGLSLLWRRKAGPGACMGGNSVAVPLTALNKTAKPAKATLPGGLFLMGAGMALNPCAPLGTVLLAASTTGSALAGLGLGLGFAAGAVVIPALVFAFGVAHFGRQLRAHLQRWRPGLEVGASAMLILLGLVTVLGWVRP
jgi:cytochrome c biogenesis protein CcdA